MTLATVAALLAAACSGSRPATIGPQVPPSAESGPPIVYVSIGASETVGFGTKDPLRQAWPQVLLRSLPRSTVLYNLGIAGATTAQALRQELPDASAVGPTLVTVWLNVNDLVGGVTPAAYEAALQQLVHALRGQCRTRVLVANTPALDRLPAYLACRQGARVQGAECPFGRALPDPDSLNTLVDEYNDAIDQVVQAEGATLVDLHSLGEVPDSHPEYVSEDGFHPSAAGHAAVAAAFRAALA